MTRKPTLKTLAPYLFIVAVLAMGAATATKFTNLEVTGTTTLTGATTQTGSLTCAATVTGEQLTSTDDATVTDDLAVGGNINLTGNLLTTGTVTIGSGTGTAIDVIKTGTVAFSGATSASVTLTGFDTSDIVVVTPIGALSPSGAEYSISRFTNRFDIDTTASVTGTFGYIAILD